MSFLLAMNTYAIQKENMLAGSVWNKLPHTDIGFVCVESVEPVTAQSKYSHFSVNCLCPVSSGSPASWDCSATSRLNPSGPKEQCYIKDKFGPMCLLDLLDVSVSVFLMAFGSFVWETSLLPSGIPPPVSKSHRYNFSKLQEMKMKCI